MPHTTKKNNRRTTTKNIRKRTNESIILHLLSGSENCQDGGIWPGSSKQAVHNKHVHFRNCARATAASMITDKEFSPYYY